MELAARPRRRCTSCWREGAESPARPGAAAAARPLTPGRPPGVRPRTLIFPNPGAWPRGWPTQTARAVDNRAAVEEAIQGRPRDDERALGLWRPRHATGLATPPTRLG